MTDAAPPCPLCGRELGDPRAVHVCHSCHAAVVDGGTVRVSTTGEFRVEQILAAAAEHQAADVAPAAPDDRAPADAAVRCSWCDKTDDEVRKLLSRGSAHICNECVALCAAVLQAELGDDWQ